jgi:hypothetical protein
MTMRKPDDPGTLNAILAWVNPKTVIPLAILIVASHYAVSNRVTVVEQTVPGLREQVTANRVAIDLMHKDFVDINRYNIDQQNLELQLTAIRESQDRILGYLVAANQKGK